MVSVHVKHLLPIILKGLSRCQSMKIGSNFGRSFYASSKLDINFNVKTKINVCYSNLNILPDASLSEVREAYIKSAKKFHPDSGAETSSVEKFAEIRESYKFILEQRKDDDNDQQYAVNHDELQQVVFDIKHTAPQHRQYLSFDGIGSGTPTQRQHQFQQYRVAKATDTVLDYRVQRLANEEESAMVVKDKLAAKKVKISNAIERLVEDMIQDSMKKGEFDNLAGNGQPLPYETRNPMLDTDAHNLNKILIQNGYVPEWITLQGEIRKDVNEARQQLARIRNKMGYPPFLSDNVKRWQIQVLKHKSMIADINEKIDKYNLIVPFLNKQMIPYNQQREVSRVYDNWKLYLADKQDERETIQTLSSGYHPAVNVHEYKISWLTVWNDIKQVFKSPIHVQ